MKFTTVLTAGALVLLLTACGSDGSDAANGQPMEQGDIQAAIDGAVTPEPGQYRTRLELLELSLPNIPGAGAEQARTMIERTFEQENVSCLTPEQAENGYRELLRQSQSGDCEFERFSAEGGTIDARMICATGQGQAEMTMAGSATRTSSDVTMNMSTTVAQMGALNMRVRVQSERIGDCTG